jgi:hypothetical protein
MRPSTSFYQRAAQSAARRTGAPPEPGTRRRHGNLSEFSRVDGLLCEDWLAGA